VPKIVVDVQFLATDNTPIGPPSRIIAAVRGDLLLELVTNVRAMYFAEYYLLEQRRETLEMATSRSALENVMSSEAYLPSKQILSHTSAHMANFSMPYGSNQLSKHSVLFSFDFMS
jgi:hypothetical protein